MNKHEYRIEANVVCCGFLTRNYRVKYSLQKFNARDSVYSWETVAESYSKTFINELMEEVTGV